ncbi:MAG: hypothetical protein AB1403_25110, partial [Candidatus Riflebacteria bacterium]
MKKSILVTILVVLTLAVQPVFAISVASERALNAFTRYEPDFANSMRRLEELDRKVVNQKISFDSDEFRIIAEDADDIMDYVQKRFDLM